MPRKPNGANKKSEPTQKNFEDDLPPFLRREGSNPEPDSAFWDHPPYKGNDGAEAYDSSSAPEGACESGNETHDNPPQDDPWSFFGTPGEQRTQGSFWERFRPSLMGTRKEKSSMRKTVQNQRLSQAIFLLLLGLLTFVILQQVSTGGLRLITAIAMALTAPYLGMFLFFDLKAYWNLEEEKRWSFARRFNTVLGPAIVSLSISSCIFSGPLEGKVWIVGNKTTGSYNTMYAVPLFSKIISIPQWQEVIMDVSGETADGVEVKAQISTTIVCCAEDPDQIIAIYGDTKKLPNGNPNDAVKHYLKTVFDDAFKQAVGKVKVADMKSAYANMAKGITKKYIR